MQQQTPPHDEERIDPWAALAWSLTSIVWLAGIPAAIGLWIEVVA